MTAPPPSAQQVGTREQLETLARWMGCEIVSSIAEIGEAMAERRRVGFFRVDGTFGITCWSPGPDSTWNPFTDASAAEQVLEHARSLGWDVYLTNTHVDGRHSQIFVPFEHEGRAYGSTPKDATTLAVLAVLEASGGKP